MVARRPRPRSARAVSLLVTMSGALGLTACSSSHDGYLAVAMDPAGRLLAVVAVCGDNRLGSLTLTDETTGTTTTTPVRTPPTFGGSVLLTAPIDNPRPEGAFDLLDRGHDYTLTGMVYDSDGDEVGPTTPVRFSLDAVVRNKALRTGSVLADGGEQAGADVKKDDFVAQARDECG